MPLSRIIPIARLASAKRAGVAQSHAQFRPPRLNAAVVDLPRIVSVLADMSATSGTVILLTGPPGCGKTSALARHYADLLAGGRKPRWLTVTHEDNDPTLLSRDLRQAIGSDPETGRPFEIVDQGHVPLKLPDGVDFFIDGLERIEHPDARSLIEAFMVNLSPDTSIYATAHAIRAGPFHDGWLRGIVRQVPHQDFKLTDAEAHQLLGSGWSAWEAQRLNMSVDGWAAGLRFLKLNPDAARKMINDARPAAAIPVEMAHYFDDIVCAGMDENVLAGLMNASVLDRFTAEALDNMPGLRCPWGLIEDHIRSGRFVRYLDDTRLWVAFHPAFGRHLRHRLRHVDPARFEQLQHFAALWFQENGFPMEAVRHASALSDATFAMRVMENAGGLLAELGNGPFMENEQPVSLEQPRDLPMVFMSQIYLKVRTGYLVEARSAFEQMRAHTLGFTVFAGRADERVIIGFAHIMETLLDLVEDRVIDDERIASLEHRLSQYLGSEPIIAAGIASLLSMAYNNVSRHLEAAAVCDIGLNAVRDLGPTKVAIFLRVQQGAAALARETVGKAALYIEDGARLAQAEGDFGAYEMLATQMLRAELHYEANELDAAQALIEPALLQIQHISGWVTLFATGFAVAASIAGIRSGFEAADARLQAGDGFARQRRLLRLELFISIARLRELIRAREWRQATQLIERPAFKDMLMADPHTVARLRMQVPALLESARLMIEMGRLRDAGDYLERVNKAYLDDADNRQRFTFRILAMRIAFGLRRYNAAVEHMQVALTLAMQAGLLRRAITNRLSLVEVFDWSIRNGRHPSTALVAFVNDVLRGTDDLESGAMILRRRPRRGSVDVTPNFTLSPRETEIIALVAEGYLTKEIAVRLSISEGTVKSHRKKIHEKLGVASRSQAIVRARELLII